VANEEESRKKGVAKEEESTFGAASSPWGRWR